MMASIYDGQSLTGALAPMYLQDLLSQAGLWNYGDIPYGARDRNMWLNGNDFSALQGYSYSQTGDTATPGESYGFSLTDPSGNQVASTSYTNPQTSWIETAVPLVLGGMAGAGLMGLGGAGAAGTASGLEASLLPFTPYAAEPLALSGGLASTVPTMAEILGGATIGGAAGSTGLASGLLPFTPYTGAPLELSGGLAPSVSTSVAGLPALSGGVAVDPYDAKFYRDPAGGMSGINGDIAPPVDVSGSGLLGSVGSAASDFGSWALKNPGLAKLIGTIGGGLLGSAMSGPTESSGPTVNMSPKQSIAGTSTLRPYVPSQGLPSGLGSVSAGLFDEYMKKQLNGGQRTFNAPTFGG